MQAQIAAAPVWHSDGELAAEIRPTRHAAAAVGAVLLTGATGYLGRHLLQALLGQRFTHVYCLARPSEHLNAAARVRSALGQATPPIVGERLRVFAADLSLPDLGLSPRDYARLAREVSVIVHCAADVSWSRSYAKLRATNVWPVAHLLRLACHGPAKHFALISSMAVCYSAHESLHTSEQSDPIAYVSSMPLGYAQSKAVAESLVRQAAERGLSASIFRPALIAGHSASGQANAADFVSWLVSGCIRMGYAPDVEWQLDMVPVDYVAAAITLNLNACSDLRTLHIAHPQPRDWRALVLFLNLYGYPVRLEPFARWLDRLGDFPDPTLPLRRFIGFFGERPPGCGGRTASQIYQAEGNPRISSRESSARLLQQGLSPPRLDAAYFGGYLAALVQAGSLDPPGQAPPRRPRAATLDESVWDALECNDGGTRAFGRAAHWRLARFEPSASITTEIISWRHGGCIGLYGVADSRADSLEADMILKVRALDEEALATAIAVAAACDPELGRLCARFASHLEFHGGGERELAVYRSGIAAIVKHAPHCYAFGREPGSGRVMLLLERLNDGELLDSIDQPHLWSREHIETALRDLAVIHAIGYGGDLHAVQGAHVIPRFHATDITAASELWSALYRHERRFLEEWGSADLLDRVGGWVASVAAWAPRYASHSPALVHNDCNPRNMAFGRDEHGLVTYLYDWELCALAPPQRDLAELLCFTLDAQDIDTHWLGYVELHRSELARRSGCAIDPQAWRAGFRLALADFMLRRLSLYMMLHTHVRQRFLPRVVRCWDALDRACDG